MLNITNDQLRSTPNWDELQQPVHSSHQQAAYLRLLAALDSGWQILEAIRYLAHGTNAEGRSYQLTLFHPKRLLTSQIIARCSSELDSLLLLENVPGLQVETGWFSPDQVD